MAKFLTTVGNSFYIEQIILNSINSLTLVTPYLKLSRNLLERIYDADKENIRITLIYGKNQLANSEKEKLYSLKNIEILYCENLHAKCYFNESSMIITSMNLYEFSERNNREMGILIDKENDLQIFNDTLKEVESIKNSSMIEKDFSLINENNLIEKHLKLTSKYNEQWNFYLPSIEKILQTRYPSYDISFKDHVTVIDFPYKGIDLIINGRIDFKFNSKENFEQIKKRQEENLKKLLPEIRFYWNHKQINIYLERGFEVDINLNGLEKIVTKKINIIDTVFKLINEV
ncbi:MULTISPECIES: phospholipase D family protein [Flavobacterium]|uniref:Phospholipase D family protein n=1 Tax=Flavobacterium jumunjinense TaxID=998845 RepID=A0ABV5GUQ8_9FLAO|nr:MULTISPECIES: phospholipase D family protein [Flavobacterium]